jgi:hypothetical protein
VQVDFAKHKEAYIPQLREMYKLSDAEVEQFRTAPEESIPSLAANLHYQVQLATFQSVMSVMPQILDGFMAQRTAISDANKAFFDQWPALAEKKGDPKAIESIQQSIRAYKAANPNADLNTVIKGAGMLAAISLGIPLESMVTTPPAPVPAPPAAPSAPAPAKPAGAGSSGAPMPAPSTGKESDIFADLVNETLAGRI